MINHKLLQWSSVLLLSFLVLFTDATAATVSEASGLISQDVTWQDDTVKVTGNVIIADNITLTIMPGTYVKFMGYYELGVQGTVKAEGTTGDTVYFSVYDTTGWIDYEAQDGSWAGITFLDSAGVMADNDSSVFSHCKFSYAKAHYQWNRYGGAAIASENFHKIRISNCSFIRNQVRNNGGAINLRYADIVLRDCYFYYNIAYGGGCIYSNFSSPKIRECVFFNNSARGGGGAVSTHNGTPEIISCQFNNNYCNADGALYCGGGDSAIIIDNVFSHNYAKTRGGAAGLLSSRVLFRNNEIYENDAGYGSAGLYISGGEASLIDSNLIYMNNGNGIYISGGHNTLRICHNEVFDHNESGIFQFSGGGIFEYNDVHGNTNSGDGGGMVFWGGSPVIRYNRIYNNSSSEDGGGISIEGNSPFVYNNIISNNTAPDGGGVNIRSDCKLIQNIIVNNQAGRGGAGFIDENANPLILNNTICMNKASGAGDAGAFLVESYTYPRFYNNIIYDNLAGSDSNQFKFLGLHPDFEFYNNDIIGGMDEFIQPDGSQFMGAYEDNVDLPPALIDPSTTHGTAGDGLSADWRLRLGSPCINLGTSSEIEADLPSVDYFGNERVRYSQVDLGVNEYHDTIMEFCGTIESDTIWAADTISVCGDVSVNRGATLRILPGVVIKFQGFNKMTVNGSIIAEGTRNDTIVFTAADTSNWDSWSQPAGWIGLYINSSAGEDSSRLAFCRFELCNKMIYSGVLSVSNNTKLTVRNCLFYHNETLGGAGITLDNSPILISDCDFIKNNTPVNGGGSAGAIRVISSNAIIENCRFRDGYSYRGVIYVEYGAPEIRNCTFYNNKSRDFCGAIYMVTKTGGRIHNNIFHSNNGWNKGGAMYLDGNPVVTRNFIFNNFASSGAGIYGNKLKEGTIIRNNVIVNNRGSSGVGMDFYGDANETPRIIVANNTIANNQAKNGKGAGIYTVRANLDLRNNILWGNRRGSESDQINIRNLDNGIVDISHCIIEHGLDSMREDQPSSYTNNIDSLPFFLNPTEAADSGYYSMVGDWALLPISPGIDNGDPSAGEQYTGSSDILGLDRIHNQRVDMGAIENRGGLPVITMQPEAQILCESDSAVLRVEAADSAFYQWIKDGIEIEGATRSSLKFDALEVDDQGSYQCILMNSYGTATSNAVLLQVMVNPYILQQPAFLWAEENTTVTLETFAQGTDLSYQWLKDNTEIPGTKTPKLLLEDAELDDEGLYHCVISNSCSSIETDTVNLFMVPQICMVTVSEATGHNLVVWEKGSIAPILGYNVYRISSAAGIYNLLATIPEDELSVYVDTVADPTVQAYLYKITAVDTSGTETDIDLCKPHKTIHLLVSTNPELNTTQLAWDNYFGFEYTSYTIYRSATGTNFTVAHTMASNFNSWTDPSPQTGDMFYRIAVDRPIPCYPSGGSKKAGTGPYQHALSNMDDNKLKAGENPPDSMYLDNISIDENKLPGSLVGRMVTIDIDTADYYTYHLVEGEGDDDNGSFSIIGDLLVSAKSFNFETKSSYKVRIRTTDNAAYYLERTFLITINDTGEGGSTTGSTPPDSITLDNISLAENNLFGDPVGRLITADKDSSDIHTYQLISGTGSEDNLSFMITGDVLRAATLFDFEQKEQYTVRIRSTDLAGNSIEKVFIISILDVQEPALGIPGLNSNSLQVYPNPISYAATVYFPNPEGTAYSMRITNLAGRTVMMRDNIKTSKFTIYAGEFDKGYYFIELKGERNYRGKFMVD